MIGLPYGMIKAIGIGNRLMMDDGIAEGENMRVQDFSDKSLERVMAAISCENALMI